MIVGVINKVHGIHQGTKKTAMIFGIDTYNFFKNLDAAEPLNFDSIGDLLSSVTFNEAKTVTDDEKVTDLRNAIFLPPILAKLLFTLTWISLPAKWLATS